MSAETLRLDKYLWFARLARTRSTASRFCAEGKVALNGIAAKANRHVRIGDRIAVEHGQTIRTLRVTALDERRRAAAAAQMLYEETAPPSRPRASWIPLFEET